MLLNMIKKWGLIIGFLFCSTVAAADTVSSAPTMQLKQDTAFGRVEITSCTTALRKSGPLYLAVQAVPHKGWQLDTPKLTVRASDDTPVAIFEPFLQENPKLPVYPISAVPLNPKNSDPIHFFVDGTWHACADQKCVTEDIHLSLLLEPNIPLISPTCKNVAIALSNTPIPAYMDQVKGWAIPKEDHVAITLEFQKIPLSLMIYNAQKQPFTLEIQTKDKRAMFKLPHTGADPIKLFARTKHHYYEIELPLLPRETQIPLPRVPWGELVQAVICLILLSALPIFWARATAITQKKFHLQTIQMMLVLGILGIIAEAILLTTGSLNLTFNPLSKTVLLIVMALGLLYIPLSAWIAAPILILTPKPYLAFLNETSVVTQSLVICGAFFLALSLFALQLFYEKQIFKALHKKNISTIWWCARLPWIGFMLYLAFHL